jgi:hypothetical protein
MQKYAVYWPEGGAASQYSVFIGQKIHELARKMAPNMRNETCASTDTSKLPT